MKITIGCGAMNQLTGSPLYHYELARELAKEHDVTLVSWFYNQTEASKPLKTNLEAAGVQLISTARYVDAPTSPDFLIVSQPGTTPLLSVTRPKPITINVIHSEYEVETPITEGIDGYVAVRPSIKEHLSRRHGIERDKVRVIYNGIDTERFNPRQIPSRNYKLTVIPCTLDPLRSQFLQHMVDQANEKRRIIIAGTDYGAAFDRTSKWVKILPETFDVEDIIGRADEVAGILLGRVNIEASAMGIPSTIYDPVTLEKTYFPAKFDPKFDIRNVAKEFLSYADELQREHSDNN